MLKYVLSAVMSLFFLGSVSAIAADTPASSSFPAIGKTVEVSFGGSVFHLNFTDAKKMTMTAQSGEFKGFTDTVEYTAQEIRPQVFMVYWREEKLGNNVVHVEDYERGIVHTNIIQADGKAFHLSGTLRILDGAAAPK